MQLWKAWIMINDIHMYKTLSQYESYMFLNRARYQENKLSGIIVYVLCIKYIYIIYLFTSAMNNALAIVGKYGTCNATPLVKNSPCLRYGLKRIQRNADKHNIYTTYIQYKIYTLK